MLSMTVLTDGRQEYLAQALPTWIDAYEDKIVYGTIIDDSGDADYRHWLIETFPNFAVAPVGKDRCGYAKAMRRVFEVVLLDSCSFNLHIEDDFILHSPPDLDDIIETLRNNPDLAQMSLMRQPWYANEIQHGGLVEALEADGGVFEDRGGWTKHRAYFTCNPSVFPRWLAERTWPDAPWSEMKFSKGLIADGKSYGIWGTRGQWECVEHIGRVRNGTEY